MSWLVCWSIKEQSLHEQTLPLFHHLLNNQCPTVSPRIPLALTASILNELTGVSLQQADLFSSMRSKSHVHPSPQIQSIEKSNQQQWLRVYAGPCPPRACALLPKVFLLRVGKAGKATLQDTGQTCHPREERLINVVLQIPAFLVSSRRERKSNQSTHPCLHIDQSVTGESWSQCFLFPPRIIS